MPTEVSKSQVESDGECATNTYFYLFSDDATTKKNKKKNKKKKTKGGSNGNGDSVSVYHPHLDTLY